MRPDEFFAMICGSIVIIVMPLFLAFTYMTLSRYWRHKETIALAERGVLPQVNNSNGNRNTLRWGVITTFLGLALCLGTWPIGFLVGDTPFGLGPWMIIGLIPMFFGFALLVIYTIGRGEEREYRSPAPEAEVPPSKYNGE
ncbi:MAG: hypothetical protein IPL78_13875 [Chloroflexi bacterium]|nr:hypothetical protein [Chloroflexota bacterium]